MEDSFLSITKKSEGIYKDKGSKFIAIAVPVETEEDVKEELASLRKSYHDARHHCYAYVLGIKKEDYRVNDDGEPSGSAGLPIYNQIQSYNITNVLIVVVRYFGGTKLGIPGLIKAYKNASIDALEKNAIIKKYLSNYIDLEFPYAVLGDVERIIKEEKLETAKHEFGIKCNISLKARISQIQRISDRFSLIPGILLNIRGDNLY